jgi:deoxyribose-phosphate aldolase
MVVDHNLIIKVRGLIHNFTFYFKNDTFMSNIARELLSYVDLTTLNATDTVASVNLLTEKAVEWACESYPVAAVCVFPNFAALVKYKLEGTNVKTAVVAGAFPHGQSYDSVKKLEVELASKEEVDEIDIVLNRGLFFANDFKACIEEITLLKKAAGKAQLKVILETGELNTEENIRNASLLAMKAGADFIKTSTGKSAVGATEEAARCMADEILKFYKETNKKVGLKVSGGIRTLEEALVYRNIVKEILGSDWLNPQLFRIGASSLANDLVAKIVREIGQ